jgi:hypothetical protein
MLTKNTSKISWEYISTARKVNLHHLDEHDDHSQYHSVIMAMHCYRFLFAVEVLFDDDGLALFFILSLASQP